MDSSCSGQPIHLWQFLKELLLKPHSYGRFIRWLNKEKGEWFWGQDGEAVRWGPPPPPPPPPPWPPVSGAPDIMRKRTTGTMYIHCEPATRGRDAISKTTE